MAHSSHCCVAAVHEHHSARVTQTTLDSRARSCTQIHQQWRLPGTGTCWTLTCLDIQLVIQRVRQGRKRHNLAGLQALLHQAPPHGQHQQDAAHVMRSAAVLPGLLDQGDAQHDDQREEEGGYSPGVEAQGPCRDRAAQCSLVLVHKVRLLAAKLICRERPLQDQASGTLHTRRRSKLNLI